MFHKSRAIFLFLTIVSVMLVSAVGTTSVYADDGTPPPAETEVVDPPAPEGEVATEVAPTVEPVATDVPVEPAATEAPVEPAATEAPAEAAPTEAPVVEEQPAEPEAEAASLLEQVPDNTEVTVLNAEGEAQPLSTEESAQAILTGDPIWCPYGTLPGGTDCTDSFDSLGKLLSFLDTNEDQVTYQRPGTIYVEMGTYTGPETSIDFNTYNFTAINNYNLTVQGGWAAPGVSIDPTNPTQFSIPITVGSSTNPWVGSLAFNNISLSGVTGQTALTLFSQGNIALSNVTVTNSQGGADLNAGGTVLVDDSKFNNNKKFGAKIKAGDYVNITGSEPQNPDEAPAMTEFNNNGGNGLEVDSQSDIFLQYVSASNNNGFGADLDAGGYGAVLNSVFNGNVSYTYTYCGHKTPNGGYGLQVVSDSLGYLENVTAKDNYLFGAHVEAPEVEVYTSAFDHNGSGSISNPKGYGLEVISAGGATLDGVEANDNQKFGANISATGDVVITNSFFNGNKSYKCSCNGTEYFGYGLQVVTSGEVAMRNVTATGNYLWGAHLEGSFVSVRDGVFSNNGNGTKTLTGKGLEIISSSQVALRNVEANNNQLFGANIQAAGNVSITQGFFNGQKFTYTSSCGGTTTTGGYGLQISTTGDIALTWVEAKDNYKYGAQLDGSDIAISEDPTTGVNSLFNNNGQYGLKITSSGTEQGVALRGVEASGNKLFGADITAAYSVAVRDAFFNGNQSYTSTSCGHKTYSGYGIKVVTTADIDLRDVTANQNYDFGAYLQGTDVRVTDSSFSNNGTGTLSDHIGKGLEVVSSGSGSLVNLTGVTANNNQIFGASVTAEGLVLVTNSLFIGNKSYTGTTCGCKTYDGYGLQVVTTSDIRLTNVTANENYKWGAKLQGANVTVTDSIFSSNVSPLQSGKLPTGEGLEVKSTGNTLLQGVEASNNQLFGALVQADGKVDVIDSVFDNNKYAISSSCKGTTYGGYGLKVVSLLTATDPLVPVVGISLTNVQANGNGAEGAILDGQAMVEVANSQFNNNGADGLKITAKDNVKLTNLEATGNKGDGVDITGDCAHTATVVGGTFASNSKYGIRLTNILYAPDGTQTFGSNGSGDVSQSGCATTSNVVAGSNATTSSQTGSSSSSNSSHGWWGWWSWFGHRH